MTCPHGATKRADQTTAPHRILVIGGGAGGPELATRLGDTLGRRGLAEITLIDKARAHLWKPLLHEIAAVRSLKCETALIMPSGSVWGDLMSGEGKS